jgi:four helix bundle protein
MAIGSSGEVGVWLDYCADLGYIDGSMHQAWSKDCDSISRMLQNPRSKTKI